MYIYYIFLNLKTGLAYRNFDGSELEKRNPSSKEFPSDETGDLAVLIQRIILGSIAEKSRRLKVGDEIIAINDVRVSSIEDAR